MPEEQSPQGAKEQVRFFSEITVAGCEGLRLKTQRQQMKEQRCVMTTAHNHPHPIPRLSSDIYKGCEV